MNQFGSSDSLSEPVRKRRPSSQPRTRCSESAGLAELQELRQLLLGELRRVAAEPDYLQGQPAHACCTRQLNQMRMTPLEARAILLAFRSNSKLRKNLPQVLERLREEMKHLKDNDERQSFDCPLLEDGLCLVHQEAKPIGCLAWHPAVADERSGDSHFTPQGWRAFDIRDMLNDAVYGSDWKVRAIPLCLRRIFAEELAQLGNAPVTAEFLDLVKNNQSSKKGSAGVHRPQGSPAKHRPGTLETGKLETSEALTRGSKKKPPGRRPPRRER